MGSGGSVPVHAHLNAVQVYAITLGVLGFCVLAWRLGVVFGSTIRDTCSLHVRKHLSYPLLTTRWQGTTNFTRLDGLILSIYLTLNVVCTVYRIHSTEQLNQRSKTLFMINLVPLYVGGRTNFIADKVFKLRRTHLEIVHRWVGRVCAVQGYIHSVIALGLEAPKPSKCGIPVSSSPFHDFT